MTNVSGHGDGSSERPSVLVVDDEATSLSVLVEVLSSDFRVLVARSGSAALRIVHNEPELDLVLLDVVMPELDGYDVLRAIRTDDAGRAPPPVMLVTALDSDVDEEHGLALGAVDFIRKPITPPIVRARAHAQIELKRARDRLRSQNDWLEREVARRTRENETIQDVSLSVIAGLVETRDAETANHTLRTQAYVGVLGREYRRRSPALSEDTITQFVRAAPLHDIGKLGIPDAILLKPGPLTREEFTVMKDHSRIGADAIDHAIARVTGTSAPVETDASAPLRFLLTAREMARWHHERWDGKGYPDGLAGDAIPLSARLMAIADVFDAVTTKRVYKAAMPVDEAVELIRGGRGSQFDPELVDIFDAVVGEISQLARRLADPDGP